MNLSQAIYSFEKDVNKIKMEYDNGYKVAIEKIKEIKELSEC